MPTTTPLTDAITALTTYANTVTSASDTTLSDAVATLAAGYGGGGSAPTGFAWEKTVTLETGQTSGTNNAVSALLAIEPELSDTTTSGVYLFYFTNNTITNKGGQFGACIHYKSTANAYDFYRIPERWGNQMDFYYSAGTVVKIVKFDILGVA